jgi:hypothetical protein
VVLVILSYRIAGIMHNAPLLWSLSLQQVSAISTSASKEYSLRKALAKMKEVRGAEHFVDVSYVSPQRHHRVVQPANTHQVGPSKQFHPTCARTEQQLEGKTKHLLVGCCGGSVRCYTATAPGCCYQALVSTQLMLHAHILAVLPATHLYTGVG